MKMNPLTGLMKIDWSGRKLRSFDFGLAAVLALAGLFLQVDMLLYVGLAGIAFAVVNPMGRLQRFLQGFRKPAPGKG